MKSMNFVDLKDRIVAVARNSQYYRDIKSVAVFGSYAKGLAKKDSDIDIYIETADKKLKRDIELINSKIK